MADWMWIALAGVAGYLLGALPFGYWVAHLSGAGDIRRRGSGNTGATNVWRVAGKTAGLVTLLLDIVKGTAAVLVAGMVLRDNAYLAHGQLFAGVCAVGGHMFSPFIRFRGGKGVNTTLGVFLALLPVESALAAVVFVVTVWLTRYVSLGSMLGALTLAGLVIVSYVFESSSRPFAYVPITALIALGIVFAHRSNIRRLMNGTENRFSFRGRRDS